MNKEIIINCKIHGDLMINQVTPSRNKLNKEGKRTVHYRCKPCRTEKRKLNPRKIDVSEEFKKINMSSSELKCTYCKYKKNLDEYNNYQLKNKYPKCKKCESELNRKYYVLNRYKLTNDEYQKLLKEQNGVCKICGQYETATLKGITKRLSVDHCHESEKNGELKIRGLLCHHCNQGLGAFRDNPDYLKEAAKYLELNND